MIDMTMADLGLNHDPQAYNARVNGAAHEMASAVLARANSEDAEHQVEATVGTEAQKGVAFDPEFLTDFEVIAAAAEYGRGTIAFQPIDHNQ